MRRLIVSAVLLSCVVGAFAQQSNFIIHAHNDYQQEVPFWNAYSAGLQSIEVDLVLKDKQLYVAHELSSMKKGRTLETLYLTPLEQAKKLGIKQDQKVQFLIDFKSNGDESLALLLPILKGYETLIKEYEVTFVLSGQKVNTSAMLKVPPYIRFDHHSLTPIEDKKAWAKVEMVSLAMKDYTPWNGKGRMTAEDKKKVQELIDVVHQQGKKIRFWAAPDSKTAWKVLTDMGVDVIHTDRPHVAAGYLSKLSRNVFENTLISTEAYQPTYASDNQQKPIKHVILLIGDGNGLNQISAAAFANQGKLSLLNMKQIGLIKTQSANDFTTDSAAGGTALATGYKVDNRAIGVGVNGEKLTNMTEFLYGYGFKTGVITTDEIIGATPAAFYAHQKDRDAKEGLVDDLTKSKLNLFVGGGKKHFKGGELSEVFTVVDNVAALGKAKEDRVGYFLAEGGTKGVIQGRNNVLAQATRQAVQFLDKKDMPFFLMVEGSSIDTYGHFNNTGGIITEGIDFDKAVAEALRFADQNGETLVIVTADHETSGFALPQGDIANGIIEGDFISNDHTGTMVPLFAYGPQSGAFTGVYENSDLFHKIIKLLNLKKQ